MMQVIHFLMRFPTVNRGYSRTRPSTVLVTPIAFQIPRPRKTRVHSRDSVIKSSLLHSGVPPDHDAGAFNDQSLYFGLPS